MSKGWPSEFTLARTTRFATDFPRLYPYHRKGEISPATEAYNCIAWAAGDTTKWWEPDEFEQYFWPEGVAREYTLDTYVAAFRSVGFEVCQDGSLEKGTEKIVLYLQHGEPTHAARGMPNGHWTSKLGSYEDIEHIDLDCLHGPLYGKAEIYMKRSALS